MVRAVLLEIPWPSQNNLFDPFGDFSFCQTLAEGTCIGGRPLVSGSDGQFVSGPDSGAQGEALPDGSGTSAFLWGAALLLFVLMEAPDYAGPTPPHPSHATHPKTKNCTVWALGGFWQLCAAFCLP